MESVIDSSQTLLFKEKELVKWVESNKASINGNTIMVYLDNQHFTIVLPEDYLENKKQLLMIDFSVLNDGFQWLTEINNYSITKKPSLGRLLRHIEKKHLQVKNERKKTFLQDDNFENILNKNKNKDKFDIQLMKREKSLRSNMKNMKSSIDVEDGKKTTILFKKNVPGEMILNEFMKLSKNFYSSDKIKIDLDNDNIYSWKLKFFNFKNQELSNSLKTLKDRYGYDCIELSINFHSQMYPSYPPFVKVVRPRLEDSLMNRISNMQMLSIEYWEITRSLMYIIDKLYTALENHGKIDVENDMNDMMLYPDGAYHPLEEILVKLASLSDLNIFENYKSLDDAKYEKPKVKTKKAANTQKSYWKSGTGYSYDGVSGWDVNEYLRLQKEKDIQIQSIIQSVINSILETEDQFTIYKILKHSYLIPFLKSYFNGTTLMEISKHRDMYQQFFSLIQILSNENGIFLFDDDFGGKNLYTMISELHKEAEQAIKISNQFSLKDKIQQQKEQQKYEIDEDDNNGDISDIISVLYEMITPCFNIYMENKMLLQKEEEKKKSSKNKKNKDKENKDEKLYQETLEEYRFEMKKFIEKGFKYTVAPLSKTKTLRRLPREFGNLGKNLPVYLGSSIFVCVDETNSRCLRVLITGPKNTPYDSGVFLFDLYIGDEYPESNPKMTFLNHGGIRFNPNLYDSGYVCLSLLGTWRGSAGENWEENTSSILQLLISVQAQILIDDPVFNEPGHEKSIGSSNGNQKTKTYNNYIRYYTMLHAMYNILANNSYPEFKEVIQNHFKLKKDYILENCKKWVNESFDSNSSIQHRTSLTKNMYEDLYKKLEKCLNEL